MDTTPSLQHHPETREERDRIHETVNSLQIVSPLTRKALENLARSVVQDPQHIAWTMVLIGSRFWKERIRTIPFNKRVLLLPHCMRNEALCPAKYDAVGLLCQQCGACELSNLKSTAQSLGYQVLVAEGSPVVMQWILNGKADGILGVGCLRSLERAFDKLQLAGIPALAVPLHGSNCRNSTVDLDRVLDMIRTPYDPPLVAPKSLDTGEPTNRLRLLRMAAGLFDKDAIPVDTPLEKTERLARQFLGRGGKFYRPFITLATYDALSGPLGTELLPDWVLDAARAVEIFHKASLIHDDIEDEDRFRYGKPTLHCSEGTATAINVGDYLLGLGYKTIAGIRRRIPATISMQVGEIVSEMIAKLSEAHTRLSEGQGAELAWKTMDMNLLTPTEVIKIYLLKTSPAFEAALSLGILAAVASGGVDYRFYQETEAIVARFSRHLGAAFQIKNDLDDWRPNQGNKRDAGTDVLHNRPTLLRAFAGPALTEGIAPDDLDAVKERFRQLGIFDKAYQLVGKYAIRARETAEEIEHPAFRQLLLHFVEAIAMVQTSEE